MALAIFLELIMLCHPLSRKSDGLPTGAVSGFCSMLFKLLEDARADDSERKTYSFCSNI